MNWSPVRTAAGDPAGVATAFDHWCTENIAPWFHDHVHSDAALIDRWTGAAIDLTRPLPSDLVVAAAAADPSLMPLVAPYLGMRALPASLDPSSPASGRSTPTAGARPSPRVPPATTWPT